MSIFHKSLEFFQWLSFAQKRLSDLSLISLGSEESEPSFDLFGGGSEDEEQEAEPPEEVEAAEGDAEKNKKKGQRHLCGSDELLYVDSLGTLKNLGK